MYLFPHVWNLVFTQVAVLSDYATRLKYQLNPPSINVKDSWRPATQEVPGKYFDDVDEVSPMVSYSLDALRIKSIQWAIEESELTEHVCPLLLRFLPLMKESIDASGELDFDSADYSLANYLLAEAEGKEFLKSADGEVFLARTDALVRFVVRMSQSLAGGATDSTVDYFDCISVRWRLIAAEELLRLLDALPALSEAAEVIYRMNKELELTCMDKLPSN